MRITLDTKAAEWIKQRGGALTIDPPPLAVG